jgi:Flp pilus assembly protein TadG
MRFWQEQSKGLDQNQAPAMLATCGSFARDQRAAVLPIMAAFMMVAAGGAALAVDVGRAYAVKSDLQTAADSAALAAAVMLPDVEAAMQAAQRAVDRSLPDLKPRLTSEDLKFGEWNASTHSLIEGTGKSAVRVTVQLAESRGNALNSIFAGIIGESSTDVAASAAAGKSGVFCLLALDQKGEGLEIDGESSLELTACSAQVNANKKDALKVHKKSEFFSDGVCVTGGASVTGDSTVSPQPSEYCPPHADPLAGLQMPEIGACTDEGLTIKDETVNFSTGRVFCNGLKLEGSATAIFEPGLYVIDDGKFELSDDARIEGDGVTIVLHGDAAELDIKNRASMRLTAPTEGPLKGLLIAQVDGNSGKPKENKWDSSEASELTGVVYLPDGKFTSLIESNIMGTDACFVLIAKQIKLDNKATMSIDLSGTGCRGSLPAAFSRSVVLLG